MLLRPIARRSRTADRTRGQALVEFALVFPLFVLLLFGLVDLGRLAYINNAIAEAAREGARWGTVQGRSISAAGRTTIEEQTKALMAAVPNPTVTVTCEDVRGVTKATCTTGDVLVVHVEATVAFLTPVIGQWVGASTVAATSKMIVNG
jgi:Flp pilus assembly protein TadG